MGEKCASWLTEAIHIGNAFNSSVASLRPLDAFLRNWWWPSVGIVGGIPRNTHKVFLLFFNCIEYARQCRIESSVHHIDFAFAWQRFSCWQRLKIVGASLGQGLFRRNGTPL